MKKGLCFIQVILIVILFAACGSSGTTQPQAPPDVSEGITAQTSDAVVFNDAALEARVREAIGKPEGDITLEEAAAVTKLDLSNEGFDDMNSKNGGIKDISALKYFTGLEDLNISYNNVSDLSPLAELKSIKVLGFNGIRADNLSVLKGLTNMTCLIFDWTWNEGSRQAGNVSLDFMSDMKDLEIFSACGGGIKDISALGNLTKIWSLYLDDNAITDISPLANLTKLKELKLSKNLISDFSPLKDIYPNLDFVDFEME